VSAISLAIRVASEMGGVEGDLVGYRVRFEEKLSFNTRIKFLTDGMLMREAILDKDLDSYGMIILDEAHERTVNSDTLLALMKQIALRRSNLKILIMSATFEMDKFCKYFGTQSVVKVEGRAYPIEVYHTL